MKKNAFRAITIVVIAFLVSCGNKKMCIRDSIQAGGRKILTTYDSLGKIVEVLLSSGECLQEWLSLIHI